MCNSAAWLLPPGKLFCVTHLLGIDIFFPAIRYLIICLFIGLFIGRRKKRVHFTIINDRRGEIFLLMLKGQITTTYFNVKVWKRRKNNVRLLRHAGSLLHD